MRELYITCEGQTEQNFCNQILAPHFYPAYDIRIHTIRVVHNQHHGRRNRGGMPEDFSVLRRQLRNELNTHRRPGVFFTTMLDLYGLPSNCPGKDRHTRNPSDPTPYVKALEEEFELDLGDTRFLAYLQLHEFETLLLADAGAFTDSFPNAARAIRDLAELARQHAPIEQINDGPLSAPSKRIIKLIPEYGGRKPTVGPAIAARIGLPRLRAACPHFDAWVARLERL